MGRDRSTFASYCRFSGLRFASHQSTHRALLLISPFASDGGVRDRQNNGRSENAMEKYGKSQVWSLGLYFQISRPRNVSTEDGTGGKTRTIVERENYLGTAHGIVMGACGMKELTEFRYSMVGVKPEFREQRTGGTIWNNLSVEIQFAGWQLNVEFIGKAFVEI